MATQPAPILASAHDFHAEAYAINLPSRQNVGKQATVSLSGEEGGHFYQRIDNYRLEGLISFQAGYTHVSGNTNGSQGWATLSTSVLEGLNILDVITADRIVAQVSTQHAVMNGHVPTVTFLGTRFDNLRVAGRPVTLDLDLGICGQKPDEDMAYLDDADFMNRVEWQRSSIMTQPGLPTDLHAEYDGELKNIKAIQSSSSGLGNKISINCSLIKSIEPISGANVFGNVLEIPGVGIVWLAEVEVGVKDMNLQKNARSNYFNLTMLKVRMGALGGGVSSFDGAGTNGHTRP